MTPVEIATVDLAAAVEVLAQVCAQVEQEILLRRDFTTEHSDIYIQIGITSKPD